MGLECNLADLNNDEDHGFRKIRLTIEDVQGRNCLTDFHGMSLTRDRVCSLVKKWQTLIEANTDVKTTDGYTVRLFCIAFSGFERQQQRSQEQGRVTTYCQSGHIRRIRKKMVQVMQAEGSKVQLRDLVKKFIPESIGKEIEKQCLTIYPLHYTYIRKCKVLKKPKFDITRLMELHEKSSSDDAGAAMKVAEATEAKNLIDGDAA